MKGRRIVCKIRTSILHQEKRVKQINDEMKREKEYFTITSIHRDDLITAGYDGNAVDDSVMERLASKMCDDYVEQLFWIHIGVLAENLGVPKIKKNSEDD